MSQTGIPAFDHTLQTTNVWLNEIMDRLGWQEKPRAYHALRVVLHALRDRLPVDHAVALGAQLPLLIRGCYYDGWHPAGKPLKERRREEFLAHVAAAFPGESAENVEAATRAVFQTLRAHISAGEIVDVKNVLPEEIRELWSREAASLWG